MRKWWRLWYYLLTIFSAENLLLRLIYLCYMMGKIMRLLNNSRSSRILIVKSEAKMISINSFTSLLLLWRSVIWSIVVFYILTLFNGGIMNELRFNSLFDIKLRICNAFHLFFSSFLSFNSLDLFFRTLNDIRIIA